MEIKTVPALGGFGSSEQMELVCGSLREKCVSLSSLLDGHNKENLSPTCTRSATPIPWVSMSLHEEVTKPPENSGSGLATLALLG